jgi:NTP pyrophosphatase (non-canonical NTP hydrolase)
MNILEIVKRTERTYHDLELTDRHKRLLHGAMLLASEAIEYAEATTPENEREELGDVFYSLHLLADELKIEIDPSFHRTPHSIRGSVEEVISAIKAYVFYGRELPNLSNHLNNIYMGFIIEALSKGVPNLETIEEVLHAKLSKRYPKKFTEALANERRDKQDEDEDTESSIN